MRAILYILTSLAVIGLAFWAYRENYATQQALSEADELHGNIRAAHARLAVLKAEWAYLNSPSHLEFLAKEYLDLHPVDITRILSEGEMDAPLPVHPKVQDRPVSSVYVPARKPSFIKTGGQP